MDLPSALDCELRTGRQVRPGTERAENRSAEPGRACARNDNRQRRFVTAGCEFGFESLQASREIPGNHSLSTIMTVAPLYVSADLRLLAHHVRFAVLPA